MSVEWQDKDAAPLEPDNPRGSIVALVWMLGAALLTGISLALWVAQRIVGG